MSLVQAPAGWHADVAQATALADKANAVSHYGAEKSLAASEVYLPDAPGVALFVTAIAAKVSTDREVAARMAVDELHATTQRAALAGSGIVVHALHPGAVDTNFASRGDAAMQEFFRTRTDILTAEEGADTMTWLVTAPEAAHDSGRYFHERRAIEVSPAAQDASAAERLWRESEKLAAGYLQPVGAAASA